MRENKLRWFDHIMRRKNSEAIRIVMELKKEEEEENQRSG